MVDLDLEKFFDKVNHDALMARLKRKISDKRLLYYIRQMLKAGVIDERGIRHEREEGTPQGDRVGRMDKAQAKGNQTRTMQTRLHHSLFPARKRGQRRPGLYGSGFRKMGLVSLQRIVCEG